jgi:phosphate transport system substrate-binding protein
LPRNLVDAGFEQVKKLHDADAAVDVAGKDASKCNNPTFDKSDLKKNKLAEIAPKPAECDKEGAGPCGGDTGSAPTTVDEATKSNTSAGGSAPTSGDAAAGAGAADPAAAGSAGAGAIVASGGAAAVPIDLVSSRAGDTRMFGAVAVLELLAVTLIPGLAAVYLRRREDQSLEES